MNKKKLKTFDAAYFTGKNYFEGNDGTQNLLVFQLMAKYLKRINKDNAISEWMSKGLSSEVLNKYSDKTLVPVSIQLQRHMYLESKGSCLKTADKLLHVPMRMIFNAYIVYSLSSNLNNFDFPSENCLVGTIRLTKNVDINIIDR